MNEIFESAVRAKEDFAGVFEADSETAYFYLYNLKEPDGKKIIKSKCIDFNILNYQNSNVSVKWNKEENIVYLYINNNVIDFFELI